MVGHTGNGTGSLCGAKDSLSFLLFICTGPGPVLPGKARLFPRTERWTGSCPHTSRCAPGARCLQHIHPYGTHMHGRARHAMTQGHWSMKTGRTPGRYSFLSRWREKKIIAARSTLHSWPLPFSLLGPERCCLRSTAAKGSPFWYTKRWNRREAGGGGT